MLQTLACLLCVQNLLLLQKYNDIITGYKDFLYFTIYQISVSLECVVLVCAIFKMAVLPT